jgi:hypothetical protein
MTVRIDNESAIFVLQDEIQRSEQARYDHRLHVVLLVAKGMTCPAVAELLGDPERTIRYWVLSSFLCKIFIGQFFEERQVLTHFSYGV